MEYTIEHLGIASRNPEVLARWYQDLLGFSEIFRTVATPPVIFLEDPEGRKLEIFPRKPEASAASAESPAPLHLAIAVADFDAAVVDLEGRGVRWLGDPVEVFLDGRARFFVDPEGNRLHIVHRPRSPWAGGRP